MWIGIEQDKRKQGYGTRLYLIIEAICKDLGCIRMQTSPSGQGNYFWPRMGFVTPCPVGLEKSLNLAS